MGMRASRPGNRRSIRNWPRRERPAAARSTPRRPAGRRQKAERPLLGEVLGYRRPGDTLVAWRLDRLGRSLKRLIGVMAQPAEQGIGFESLTEQVDPATPGGTLVFHSTERS